MSNNCGATGVAVIGCGAVAQLFYLPSLVDLANSGNLAVKALVDVAPENSKKMQTHFPAARQYSDISQLPANEIELAIVSSPNYLHEKHSIALLNSGISVLCEKPLAASAAQAKAMIDAAAAAKRVLAVGMYRRFLPSAQAVKTILSQGTLGSIIDFQFMEGSSFNWPLQTQALFNKEQAGGGILLDIGCHVLDLVIWWLGYPAEIAYADDAMGGVEANCQLSLKFETGLQGTIKLSRDWSYASSYRLNFQRGWLCWQPDNYNHIQIGLNQDQLLLNAQVQQLLPIVNENANVNFKTCFSAQLLDALAAIKQEKTLTVNPAEALAGLKLIEDCYANRTLLAMPWLSESECRKAAELNRPVYVC